MYDLNILLNNYIEYIIIWEILMQFKRNKLCLKIPTEDQINQMDNFFYSLEFMMIILKIIHGS